MRAAIMLLVLGLGACGVDGPPIPPAQAEEEERKRVGVTVTGSAEFGVSGSF